MVFSSVEFLLFLTATLVAFFLLVRRRLLLGARSLLVLASLYFYASWKAEYVALIVMSMLFNYGIGLSVSPKAEGARNAYRTPCLVFGVLANLVVLGYYKYTDFLLENLNLASGSQFGLLHLVLPLGISFFTFQQIAYIVDCHRGVATEDRFLDYLVFVTFFPQLIAGPILHHKEVMPQFNSKRVLIFSRENVFSGSVLFICGLGKKVLIADQLAAPVALGFDTLGSLNLVEAWLATLAYAMQIYFDFSGYSDMARGSARMFNIEIPVNFHSPYRATSIQEFWRRWHITLSRFLRDYVYIPLGGNRRGEARALANIFLTFLLGGLWHGAGWTFILWGALHGVANMVLRGWQRLGLALPAAVGWLATFVFACVAWVPFRAQDWQSAVKVFRGMAGQTGLGLPEAVVSGLGLRPEAVPSRLLELSGIAFPFFLAVAVAVALLAGNTNRLTPRTRLGVPALVGVGLVLAASLLEIVSSSHSQAFIYFNF